MAYSLKSIKYKSRECQILLQNENGPCPLLAVCNCLLLRDDIRLPAVAIRNNVASIDDVVNTLADHALRQNSIAGSENVYHVDELLQLFPTLQFGMDVNPKFLLGPTGVEYTSGIGVFDLMGVELVHGWLIDMQDETRARVIGSKSYNELTEMIIMGNEAEVEMEKIQNQMQELKANMDALTNKNVDDTTDTKVKEEEDINGVDSHDTLEQQFIELEQTLAQKTQVFEHGTIAQQFLEETSHQLTYLGLTELTQHIQEGQISVFFRNNHFATITKHNDTLYLLVTDLGYANHPDIMWEKLDDINGDTEYLDHNFERTKQHLRIEVAQGPTLSPEQILIQSRTTEADYQLAIQLSKNENALEEQEGKMIAAATEASLHEFHKSNANAPNDALLVDEAEQTSVGDSNHEIDVTLKYEMEQAAANRAREEHDFVLAMQLQAQLDDQDASELAASERNQPHRHQRVSARPIGTHSRRDKKACIIS